MTKFLSAAWNDVWVRCTASALAAGILAIATASFTLWRNVEGKVDAAEVRRIISAEGPYAADREMILKTLQRIDDGIDKQADAISIISQRLAKVEAKVE